MTTGLSCLLFLFWSSSSPVFSAIHAVCGSQRRTLAVAVVFCVANLVGLGLGPVLTGMISDYFGNIYGSGPGLRVALILAITILLPGGCLMLGAAKEMKHSLEA
jgi:hypothetical protein